MRLGHPSLQWIAPADSRGQRHRVEKCSCGYPTSSRLTPFRPGSRRHYQNRSRPL